jgi:hypothetical protein
MTGVIGTKPRGKSSSGRTIVILFGTGVEDGPNTSTPLVAAAMMSFGRGIGWFACSGESRTGSSTVVLLEAVVGDCDCQND